MNLKILPPNPFVQGFSFLLSQSSEYIISNTNNIVKRLRIILWKTKSYFQGKRIQKIYFTDILQSTVGLPILLLDYQTFPNYGKLNFEENRKRYNVLSYVTSGPEGVPKKKRHISSC